MPEKSGAKDFLTKGLLGALLSVTAGNDVGRFLSVYDHVVSFLNMYSGQRCLAPDLERISANSPDNPFVDLTAQAPKNGAGPKSSNRPRQA